LPFFTLWIFGRTANHHRHHHHLLVNHFWSHCHQDAAAVATFNDLNDVVKILLIMMTK